MAFATNMKDDGDRHNRDLAEVQESIGRMYAHDRTLQRWRPN